MKREIIVLIAAMLIVLPLASAGMLDWLGITGKTATQQENVNITVGNTGPNITSVSAISNVDLNKYGISDGKKTVTFTFVGYDHDGKADLDVSTAFARFTLGVESERNVSCTLVGDIDAKSRNYTCSIDMYYFDGAGSWTINASIKDFSSEQAINDTTSFTVTSLDGLDISPADLTFPAVNPGAADQSATNDPTVLNNTGNQNYNKIELNATKLVGELYTDFKIGADLFSAKISDPACSGGNAMTNSTYVTITDAALSKGNLTAGNGKEEIFYCMTSVPAGLVKQSYSTFAEGAWSIQVSVV